jgi:cell wall-associated NlpC family hydrolase
MSLKDLDFKEAALLPTFLQIPFQHRGRTMEGCDCYGYIRLWYQSRLGIQLWDIDKEYPKDWPQNGENLFIENYWRQWVKVDKPEKYDVIIFNLHHQADHTGIYLRRGRFTHMSKAGGVVAWLESSSWQGKVYGYYRHRQIAENPRLLHS